MSKELTIDNRDKDEIIGVLEARIEAMARRISELENVNRLLTLKDYNGDLGAVGGE